MAVEGNGGAEIGSDLPRIQWSAAEPGGRRVGSLCTSRPVLSPQPPVWFPGLIHCNEELLEIKKEAYHMQSRYVTQRCKLSIMESTPTLEV